MKKEPALTVAGITAFIAAICTLLGLLFHIHVSDQVQVAVVGVIVTGLLLAQAFVTRQLVYSPETHDLEVTLAQAHAADSHGELAEETSTDGDEEPAVSIETQASLTWKGVTYTGLDAIQKSNELIDAGLVRTQPETSYRP